jgi:hypothetical protein
MAALGHSLGNCLDRGIPRESWDIIRIVDITIPRSPAWKNPGIKVDRNNYYYCHRQIKLLFYFILYSRATYLSYIKFPQPTRSLIAPVTVWIGVVIYLSLFYV